MNKDDLDEQEALIDVYKRALGMLPEEDRAVDDVDEPTVEWPSNGAERVE